MKPSPAPLISILMPVHNAGPFLPECLDSILEQVEQRWELIAVENKSTDDSYAILQQYQEMDPRIHLLQISRKSIILALRIAFFASSGQLVTRMDADDIMLPQKLASLKAMLLQSGEGHVATGLVKYFSKGELGEGYQQYEAWLNGLSRRAANYSEIYKECVIPSPCWMVWRDDLIRCKDFQRAVYPEDYDLCFRFYQQRLKVVSSKKVLHRWRDHSSRSSRTDPNYQDNRFLQLKLYWFLKIDYQPSRPLAVWGAGRKGKQLARMLVAKNFAFHWLTENPRKQNINIYGVSLKKPGLLLALPSPQIIIAVADKKGRAEIDAFLKAQGLVDVFYFC